ncbi:UNVERIFIED_CONTAM: putative plastid-lipid-associated protein 13, chloroplastic [Sesamum latifolium]|uniref:Plastid-lipid-associated protein 13, chloroplastic n=1 Tax=Sesamum latifolium TaxID=2727402 RepID=A0AAW2VJR2_9LAMI
MVQQTVQGPSAAYAKEMERLSAKESLLLAFKDAGGFEALVSLSGRPMEFEWFGPGSRGSLLGFYLNIPDEVQIESNFIISSRLSVEGPLRMKEEYLEGLLESPKVDEESIPQQLKGAFGQAASTLQQLPVPIKDAGLVE